mgnify:CR=1 FL=1
MTANTKTTWSVWGILFGMAIVLGIGVAFLAFTLTRDPQILAFLYDKITVPQSLHFITNFKWIFNLLVVCVTAIPGRSRTLCKRAGIQPLRAAKRKIKTDKQEVIYALSDFLIMIFVMVSEEIT